MKLLSGEQAAQAVVSLAHRYASFDPEVESRVEEIVARVRKGGDAALVEYARRFDGLADGLLHREQFLGHACPPASQAARAAIIQTILALAWQKSG